MLETNSGQLVKISVMGKITHPTISRSIYNIGADGDLAIVPGVGGITYNKRVGDSVFGLAGDHVEPGVSIAHDDRSSRENTALNHLACIGNTARVISGEAKGATGIVTGKHGGIEHIIADFPPDTLDALAIGDKIQIAAYGAGLAFRELPAIKIMNCDPALLESLSPSLADGGKVDVPVAAIVPAKIMGSGLGSNSCHSGDYDIQMFDDSIATEYGLHALRFGDIVAITDADHSYGRIYRTGAVSIGIIIHSCSRVAGHGPGVTTIMTSATGAITPIVSAGANIATLLNIA